MKTKLLFQRLAIAVLLAVVGSLQGFAAYYTQATATVIGGEGGTVYVGTTNATPADDAYQTTVVLTNSTSSRSSHRYYYFAKAAEGYEFVGWFTSATPAANATPTSKTATAWSVSLSPGTTATTEANATKTTRYAKFAKKQNYYSLLTVNANEGGKVFASTTATNTRAWAAQVTETQTTEAVTAPSHSYYLYAQGEGTYGFLGWSTTPDGAIVSKDNPYTASVTASADADAPGTATYYAQFATAEPHYSKLILKLNGNNDISNLGTTMLGGKVYVGKTAEEAESAIYEYTSEATQMTYSLGDTKHEYYVYAKADEGFEFAGFSTGAAATTSFTNSGANPFKVTADAKSTDEANPTEKLYYASFKYAADNKPTVCYANFTVVTMLAEDDGTGKYVNVESNEPALIGINYNDDASGKGAVTTEPTWHAGSSYASEAISKPYTSGTVYFPYTIFVKPNPGYEFVGWTSTSTTTNPSQKGTPVDDYNYYYSDSYTRTSVSNVNYPGSCGVEGAPKTKKYYAVFKKLEQMDEPTGETTVQVTEVTGTTSLVEGSVSKDFTVDLVLNENVPYDKPGSEKNAKPAEVLKQFVTVTGANGNNSLVTNYSLVYESRDLGEDEEGMSLGTAYTSKTLRLSFPYGIKADTYTVHLPYGLYTTVNGNKTPTYEFTITVTADVNPYLTIKKQTPTEGLVYKYTASSQGSQDKTDPEKGLVSESNITVEVEFNEIVESIDHSKEVGITLKNTTKGVNYRFKSLTLPAAIFGKKDGRGSIAYPELVDGEYIMTIPEGLFVGANDKVNEAITINFSVTGFKNAALKPYEMITDEISPKANHMDVKIQKLPYIAISYKGEFGQAEAILGDASGINVQRYTEVIQGDGEGAKPVRTYYPVETTPSVTVDAGKMIVNFSPALRNGMYEVTIPAALAANMDPAGKTTEELFNAGYAVSPAYSLTFNVESPELWVGEHTVDYAQLTSMTTHGPVQKTTFNIIKEGDQYYLTNLLDNSEPANKIPLEKVNETTLKVANGEYTSADEESYIMYPYSSSDITFVLSDVDDQVTVPNTAIVQIFDGEEDAYYMVGGNLYIDVKEVPLVSSTPAQDDVVGGKFDIVLKFKNSFRAPFMNITSGITLKNAANTAIEVSASTGDNMEQNTIYISTQNALPTGSYTLTVDKGAVSTIEGYVNEAVELSFYVGTEESADMVVTAAKYGTFVAPFDVKAIPEGVTASKVTGSANGVLVLEAVETIPAHTPVVIQSDELVNETLTGYARSFNKIEVVTEGLLNGVYVPTQAPVGSYVLQNHSGKIGFFVVGSTIPVVAKNRCYLIDSTVSKAPAFFFTENDATAINGINAEIINAEGIYNVNGVRMNSLQKGLNIIKTANGTKKVMIK